MRGVGCQGLQRNAVFFIKETPWWFCVVSSYLWDLPDAQGGCGGGGRGQLYQVFCIVSTDQSVAGMTDSQGEGWGRPEPSRR